MMLVMMMLMLILITALCVLTLTSHPWMEEIKFLEWQQARKRLRAILFFLTVKFAANQLAACSLLGQIKA